MRVSFILIALLPSLARAECAYIGAGLRETVKEYKEYRAQHLQAIAALVTTETNCKERGATFSARLASAAQGLSCTAQQEIAAMDKEMQAIGGNCESTFQKISAAQLEVQTRFDATKQDLDEAFEYMQNSEMLRDFCAPEIKDSRKVVEAFSRLGADLQLGEVRSEDGRTSYARFKETAAQLHQLASARAQGCAGAESLSPILAEMSGKGQGARGAGAPVPRGHEAVRGSDITGTSEDRTRALPGEPAVNTRGAGGGTRARDGGGRATGTGAAAETQMLASFPGQLPAEGRGPASVNEPSPDLAAPRDAARTGSPAHSLGQLFWSGEGTWTASPKGGRAQLSADPGSAAGASAPAGGEVIALGEMGAVGASQLFRGKEENLFAVVHRVYTERARIEGLTAPRAEPAQLASLR